MTDRGRRQAYTGFAAVAAALSMGGCFGQCNLVQSASLGIQPNPVDVGDQVTFTTDISMKDTTTETFGGLEGKPVAVEFDLDGDGAADTRVRDLTRLGLRRYMGTAQRTYSSPQTIQVQAVIESVYTRYGFVEYQRVGPETLQVEQAANQPPLASFTVTPNPVVPEGQVTYDASESSDPDGQILRYEWDLNHDGTYELDTGASPTTTQPEPGNGFPGRYTVGLRVTDDGGENGTTTREVIVEHPSPRLATATKLSRRLATPDSFVLSPRLRPIDAGELMFNGDELIVQGRIDRARLSSSPFPGSLRRGKRRVRAVSTADAVIDTAAESGTARGFALLRFPAGGRGCLAFRVDSPAHAKPAGSFRIVGGVGPASGLRGRGAGEGKLKADGVSVSGRLDLGFGGKENFRLGRSGCAPLLRLGR